METLANASRVSVACSGLRLSMIFWPETDMARVVSALLSASALTPSNLATTSNSVCARPSFSSVMASNTFH